MKIKSIIFVVFGKRLVLSFVASLLIHFFLIALMKPTDELLLDKGSVSLNVQLVNVTGKKSTLQQGDALKDEKIEDAINQKADSQKDMGQQKTAVESEVNAATEDASVVSSVQQGVVTIPVPQTASVGGFFTRHLRRSAYRDLRYAAPYTTSQSSQDSQRLTLFTSQLIQVDGIECVLLDNSVECQNGYEMSTERQSEWRYLYERQMISNKISVKAEYLHR
jgi:hypothetical protein